MSLLWSLQVDESTDFSNKAQLLALIRFVKNEKCCSKFLFCKDLLTTTTSKDIFNVVNESILPCTNQQPPQRGGAVPDPVWIGSKWLLAFPRVPVTLGTPIHFFTMLPPERPQEDSTQHLQNQSPVFTFSFLMTYSCPSSSPHSSSFPDEQ